MKPNDRREFLIQMALVALAIGTRKLPKSLAWGAQKKAIVVGAGISGLAAATQLKAAGFSVQVLEARNRVGGRIWTDRTLGFACDMGAGWIHGPDAGNPITELAKKNRAKTFVTDDDSLVIFDSKGKDVTELHSKSSKAYQKLLATIDEQADEDADQSVIKLIQSIDAKLLLDPFMNYHLTTEMEFDSGGPLDSLSAANWSSDEKFPGLDVIFPDGYDAILESLKKNLNITLNQEVKKIEYSETGCTVVTNQGKQTSDIVICTIPLGVLKKKSVEFSPELPESIQDSIDDILVGHVNKVFFQFDQTFWPTTTQYFGYHSKVRGLFAYWLNYRKFSPHHCLVGIATGTAGKLIEQSSEQDLIQEGYEALKIMFGPKARPPKRALASRWNTDRLSCGSYSYANIGIGPEDFNQFQNPIKNRLFFAGEHTIAKYRGTVHGAYLSGIGAADRAIKFLLNN